MPEFIPFASNYRDRSTSAGYQFEFFCERCSNGYMSTMQLAAPDVGGYLAKSAGGLLGGGLGRMIGGTAADAVNDRAKDAALKKAIAEVAPYFAQCPTCGRYVCRSVCWNMAPNMCNRCAQMAQGYTAAPVPAFTQPQPQLSVPLYAQPQTPPGSPQNYPTTPGQQAAYPTGPAQPVMPGQPMYPPPSQPLYAAPGQPGQPVYPGAPQPGYYAPPGQPAYPSIPLQPMQPMMQPGQPMQPVYMPMQPVYMAPMPAPATKDPAKDQALSGFILGLLALLSCWILPFGFVVALVGFIFAALGCRSESRRALAILGLVFSVLAFIVGLMFLTMRVHY